MRIAITRPKERSDDTVRLVRDRGWDALIVDAIEIAPRVEDEIHKGVGDITSYDWLVLTSAFGAEIMLKLYGDSLGGLHIAAIGPKTRDALERPGLRVDLMPGEYRTEGLIEALAREVGGKRVLIARASIGREILVKELRKVANVSEVPLYDTVVPSDKSGMIEFSEVLRKGELDAVIFTSSQTAKNLFDYLGEDLRKYLGDVLVCAIGPQTSQTLEEYGVRVDIMPERYTVGACLDELEGALPAR
ncbi:MAG: uroporphyrinogen-III synthase [Candidatus Hydrothermarchaeaceae archaeon]